MKETILSVIRALLVSAGAFIIGKHFFGTSIDSGWVELVAGGVVAAVGFIWGIATKSVGTDQILAGIKSGIAFVGGLLISAGVVHDELWANITGITTSLLAIIGSFITKKQTTNTLANPLNARKLSKI